MRRADEPKSRRVTLCREGIVVDGSVVPMLAGAVHYWRLDPADWKPCVVAMRALGLRLADVYVPWSVHEVDEQRFDFGEGDRNKDVAAFLRVVQEAGLYAIVRPGPHINAEMTRFGLPERVVWSRACQARSPRGNAVLLPSPPLAFPVPSYASDAFLEQTTRFFRAVAAVLAPLRHPDGPIVLVQVDNEGALYFRDSVYDQDYHPDAIALYRKFLRRKYGPQATPEQIYGTGGATFEALTPPIRFDATGLTQLARHLDWASFQEQMVLRFLHRAGKRLRRAGLDDLPTSHNLAMAEHTTVLGQGSTQQVVDLVGLDYYYTAGEPARRAIAWRTSELALRGDAHGKPAFACEIGAGFPPFMVPMTVRDNAFVVMSAMAYGLRGFNLYMAVDRNRWIGGPIDRRGRERPEAGAFWRALLRAAQHTQLHALRRRVPVRVVVPRVLVRLRRVLHAFGPVPGAAFAIMGAGADAHCFADALGTGEPIAMAAERFVTRLADALEQCGIPFAVVGDDDPSAVVHEASWVIVATPGGAADVALLGVLERYACAGGAVSFAPNAPARDATMRSLDPAPTADAWHARGEVPWVLADVSELRAQIQRVVEVLALPQLRVEPAGLHATAHVDTAGTLRAVFVVNATGQAAAARVRLAGGGEATDALTGEAVVWAQGAMSLVVEARTVRMLKIG